MLFRKSDTAFVLVVGWAAYGISVKQAASPDVAGAATTLAILALILVGIEVGRRFLAGQRAHEPASN
jgi:hypothetical protein